MEYGVQLSFKQENTWWLEAYGEGNAKNSWVKVQSGASFTYCACELTFMGFTGSVQDPGFMGAAGVSHSEIPIDCE